MNLNHQFLLRLSEGIVPSKTIYINLKLQNVIKYYDFDYYLKDNKMIFYQAVSWARVSAYKCLFPDINKL